MRLTLAATNGLDRTQVGRVSLGWGEGITGRVAATPHADRGRGRHGRRALRVGPRLRHRGPRRDAVGAARMARHGRRRAQRPDPRRSAHFDDAEIALLRTIAALLAGIVEKGRLTAEVEARLAELTALDAARAELLSVVTHELRTPLSVVRVYVDLLGRGRRRRGVQRPTRPSGATPPPTSSGGSTGSSIRSWRRSAARA